MNKCLNVIFRTRSIILLNLDDFVLKICVTETLSHQSRIRLHVHKWPQTEHIRGRPEVQCPCNALLLYMRVKLTRPFSLKPEIIKERAVT
jgi:hypothetical protein